MAQPDPRFPDYPRLGGVNPLYVSRGFKMGKILHYANEGLAIYRYRYEGHLMLGVGTDQGIMYDNQCLSQVSQELKLRHKPGTVSPVEELEPCMIGHNPWNFSSYSDEYYFKFREVTVDPVVIYFERPTLAPHAVLLDTKNFIRGLWRVDSTLQMEESFSTDPLLISTLTPRRGFDDGRIISATREDFLRETYEVVLQQGVDSNNFRVYSVDNEQMFDFLVRSMLAGKLVRIDYTRILGPAQFLSDLRGYNTYYRIFRATIIEKVGQE